MTPMPIETTYSDIRMEAAKAPDSGIVEVFNYGRGRPGLIPLWVGEGHQPTPEFIIEAAKRSLDDGETFYTHQRGLPELRQAIADYMSGIYRKPMHPENFFVTGSGMHALQIAMRLVAGNGDEVLVPTPAWPNFEGAMILTGATPVPVPMSFGNRGWTLDMERLAGAVTPRTRAIVFNSPGNPTGWTATEAEIVELKALADRHGLWIVADEIYGRFIDEGAHAPSFQTHFGPDNRVIFVQSMSKNWAMTGWRAGWIQAPARLGQIIENMIQFSVSGVPVFTQRAAIAALQQGEPFIRSQVKTVISNRDLLCEKLSASGKLRFARPQGGLLSVLQHRRGLRFSRRRPAARRRGQYRACARNRIRTWRRGILPPLLRPPDGGCRRSRRSDEPVDRDLSLSVEPTLLAS